MTLSPSALMGLVLWKTTWRRDSQDAAKVPADNAGGLEAVVCSPASSGLTSALSMEQWELLRSSATELEDHLTCPLLSWFALTATLDPLSPMALCPSLLFAEPGLHQEASAHISSCPSSCHGQSQFTSPRDLTFTK